MATHHMVNMVAIIAAARPSGCPAFLRLAAPKKQAQLGAAAWSPPLNGTSGSSINAMALDTLAGVRGEMARLYRLGLNGRIRSDEMTRFI